jgi:hypothetical protein
MSLPMNAAVPVFAVLNDNQVSPGVLGFVVVALLGVATWLLIRSMNRQIKKIDLPEDGAPIDRVPVDPASVDPGPPGTEPRAAAEPDRPSEDG